MVQLRNQDRDKLILLLTKIPNLAEERGRRIILELAGLEELVSRINLSGTPLMAISNIVIDLSKYGRLKNQDRCEALGVFLYYLKKQEFVGIEQQQFLNRLLTDYNLIMPKETGSLPNRKKTLYEYQENIIKRLRQEFAFLDIQENVASGNNYFNVVARKAEFDMSIGPVGMRGEAFFIFSDFPKINTTSLAEFSKQSLKYAKKKINSSTVGEAFYNFKVPTNLCFAVAVVDEIDEKTRALVKTTNPLRNRVDSLWYEVPVIYELDKKQLCFYEQPSGWVDTFTGEVAWKELRKIIREILEY